MDSSAPDADIYSPLIVDALGVQASAVSPLAAARSRRACDQLCRQWRLPEELGVAALLAPLLEVGYPIATFGNRAQQLAAEFNAWRWAHPPLETDEPDIFVRRLRELFRAIRIRVDDPDFLFLLLADNDARLFDPSPQVSLPAARETNAVYRPLAEILGMWRLRRRWLEESVRLLQPAKYEETRNALDVTLQGPTSAGFDDYLVAKTAVDIDVLRGQGLPKKFNLRGNPRDWKVRLTAFLLLEAELCNRFRARDIPAPDVRLLPILPGTHVFYSNEREPDLTELPVLNLLLLCRTEDDCYRTLGAVHSLGPPVRSLDYIAAPKANGFRVLTTACMWQPARFLPDKLRLLVKFQIATPEMRELNEMGIIAARYWAPERHAHAKAWWKDEAADLDKMLSKRLQQATSSASFMDAHDLESTSNPVYCFTPLGKVHLLQEESTSLDFAYLVHTEFGHHASRIEVNGRRAELDHRLRNGDLVRVVPDLLSSRIDFAWLFFAHTQGAHGKIVAGLKRRAEQIHKGRRVFEAELIRQIVFYHTPTPKQRANHGGLPYRIPTINTARIDSYLRRVALVKYASDPEALYERLQVEDEANGTGRGSGRELAAGLAHQLISEQIIPAFTDQQGLPMFRNVSAIQLCETCRPTPRLGAHYDSYDRKKGRDGRTIVIHEKGCIHVPGGQQPLVLRAAPSSPELWPLYRFEVDAGDQPGLLGRILNTVYDLRDAAYLYRSDAVIDAQGRAQVKLVVALRLPQQRHDLQKQIEALSGASVTVLPRYRGVAGELRPAEPTRELSNLYSVGGVVTDWRFMGRNRELSDLLAWLQDQGAPQRLAAHYCFLSGQQRIGKSSVVRKLLDGGYLSDHLTSPTRAVYTAFNGLSELTSGQIARHLVAEVYRELGLDAPVETPEMAMDWLNNALAKAVAHLGNSRLLLIIDEFDAHIEAAHRLGQPPPGYAPLASVLERRTDMAWLLVVRDIFMADADFRSAADSINLAAPRVALRNLEEHAALQLITAAKRPPGQAQGKGLDYDSAGGGRKSLEDEIFDHTGGNPYLIQLICKGMVDEALRRRRDRLTHADFDQQVRRLLADRGNLDHLGNRHVLRSPHDRLLATLASNTAIREWLPSETLRASLLNSPGLTKLDEFRNSLHYLEQTGVVEVRYTRPDEVRIPIGILHRWVKNRIESGELPGTPTV